jgi:hypothetical protein
MRNEREEEMKKYSEKLMDTEKKVEKHLKKDIKEAKHGIKEDKDLGKFLKKKK